MEARQWLYSGFQMVVAKKSKGEKGHKSSSTVGYGHFISCALTINGGCLEKRRRNEQDTFGPSTKPTEKWRERGVKRYFLGVF